MSSVQTDLLSWQLGMSMVEIPSSMPSWATEVRDRLDIVFVPSLLVEAANVVELVLCCDAFSRRLFFDPRLFNCFLQENFEDLTAQRMMRFMMRMRNNGRIPLINKVSMLYTVLVTNVPSTVTHSKCIVMILLDL